MLWFALLLPLAFSCERELEYELRTTKPSLVVNSLFGQDSLFRIEISSSAQPGEGNSIQSLIGSRLFLTENGIAITDFVLDSAVTQPIYMMGGDRPVERTLYFLRSEFSKVRAGRDYHIMVSHAGYETAEAIGSTPRAARVDFLPERSSTNLMIDGKNLVEVRFSIQDDAQPHFYALELSKIGNSGNRENIEFYSFEPTFDANLSDPGNVSGEGLWYDTRDGVYFPSSRFQGAKEEFSIFVDAANFTEKDKMVLRVISMSDDYYQFAVSYQQQRRNAGNPFAEPVQVHSNVQHGSGIFAGYAVTEVELH